MSASGGSVLRQDGYLPPVTFLGSGQALPWGRGGLACRPVVGQVALVPRTASSSWPFLYFPPGHLGEGRRPQAVSLMSVACVQVGHTRP